MANTLNFVKYLLPVEKIDINISNCSNHLQLVKISLLNQNIA